MKPIPAISFTLLIFLNAAPFTSAAMNTVTSNADSGAGTLRQALANAADGDTIDFSLTMPSTILLTSGELVVSRNVTIAGPSPAILAVDGNAASRVFHVGSNNVVSISGVTITNGRPFDTSPLPDLIDYSGAGIFNEQATLTLSNCAVTGNNGIEAIYNYGANGNATLRMVNCVVSGNTGTAIGNFGSLSNVAILTIVSSTMSNSSPVYDGSGVYNSAFDNGVAILTISNCTISGFSSILPGGGILNETVRGGSANADIRCCIISGNSTHDEGGGVANIAGGCAMMAINDSTLSGNSTSSVGGGGIVNMGVGGPATLVIVNSTLSANSVHLGDTGGVFPMGGGGGILNITRDSGTAALRVVNTTLSDNFGGIFGGAGDIANGGVGGSAQTELGNCILNSGGLSINLANVDGTITSLGYNLSSDDGGGFLTATGDQTNSNPMLGPLQDNGGPTFTHALLPGSPAIDAGKSVGPFPSVTDQRGRPRPFDLSYLANAVGGDGSDIGAFELIPPVLNIALSSTNVTLSWPTNDTGYQLESTPALPPAMWTPVPGTPAIAGGRFTVTNGPATGIQFYRLKNL